MKQTDMASQSGVSYGVYQKYEMGYSVPGGEAIAGLVRLGINANWLLTGRGEMLIEDVAPPVSAPQTPLREQINIDALVQSFVVSLQTAPPGETQMQSARKAIEFYLYCVDQGLITPTGSGPGNLKAAA